MLNRTRFVAYASFVCLLFFTVLMAWPIAKASEDAVATTGTALPSTTVLTLSSTNESSVVNVVTNSSQGTFAASDAGGTAEFSVTTNNFTGYTLSISSDDDTGRLENYTHDYILSISTNTTEADFSSTNNTTYNNKWGFKPSSYVNNNAVVDNTGNNAVFLPSPTTTPTVLNVTSAANTTGDEYTLGLGIRADMLLPSGVYSKTLNLIALANVVSYTINFDANTSDTVTNMPTTVSDTTSATGITIPNIIPARSNYTFEGWCSVISPTGQCDGTTYQPNGSFGIDQTTENVTTLYAVWKPTRTMQNVYSWMNDLSDGDSIETYDVRDNKIYSVAKINGKIWMATNLDLDGGTALYSDTSNVPSGYPTSGNTPYYTLPASSMSGFDNNAGVFVYNSNNIECGQDSPCYSYYSFAAASVGTSTNQTTGNVVYDICPKGWNLPTEADFSSLVQLYPSGNDIVASIWNGVYSGRTIDGSFDHGGDMGGYWSSTIKDEYNAYFLSIDEENSRVNAGGSKSRGRAIRCVMRPTMQSATVNYLEEMLPNVGDTIILADERDGNEYPITKIDDKNFWMTSNLDLAGGTVLTAADSNVVNNYTLPESEMSGFDSTTLPQVYNSDSTECGPSSPCYSYYNYVAATAGSNPSTGNSEVDICPKGWRLPQSTEYTGLIQYYYTHDVLEAAPWNGFESGIINHGNFSAGRGLYWSSTSYDTTHGRMLIFGPQYANAAVPSNDKYDGLGVRCIIKKPYMQDYSHSDLVSELPNTGDTRDLYDARDGKKYSVTNINGTIWMTTNLDLAGGTTLTSADSNVASNYTLPASSMSGFTDNAGEYVYNSSSETCDTNTPCYGYYSYAAATAGTNPSSGDAAYDICPKGWRLPTRGEGEVLLVNYPTAEEITNGPWKAVNAGYLQNNLLKYGGEGMTYWLSTTPNETVAYNLSSVVTYNSKMYGRSIRCILKKDDISMISTLQEFSGPDKNAIVSSMTAGQTYTLRDIRDGEQYTIGKLADGKIWLLDNLRLDLTDSTVQTNLTSSTTNASDTTLNYLKNGGGTTSDQYATAGVANWTSSYSYSAPLINTASKDTPVSYAMGQSGTGSVGVYYNYCAATAGSYCYGNGTSAGTSSGNATEDICPKGWRMPTAGSSGEYQALYTAYSDRAAFVNALRIPLSGYFYDGSAYNQGSGGYFWSSTRLDSSNICIMYVSTSYVNTQNYRDRYYGYSVRCVLQ